MSGLLISSISVLSRAHHMTTSGGRHAVRFQMVTPRFKRRLPGGRYDLAFKVAFGGDGAAARLLRVSKMTIWRWRHERSPVPSWVTNILHDQVQTRVTEAHEAQEQLRHIPALMPSLPRPLSGCCAGLHRRA
jgi:hypothetical protein